MSIICATVCDHMMQCAVDCVLGGKGQTSSSTRLKNVSDTYFDRMTIPQAPKKGQAASVIGSSTAGMTVAILLEKPGYEVIILEMGVRIRPNTRHLLSVEPQCL